MEKIKVIGNYFILYLLFLLLAFPGFYFVYKYGDPEPMAHDFFQYYYLYKDFDISHVIAPHNMRIVGAYFVSVLYDLNFYFDTATAFDKYAAWGFLKQVYFNALLFNYLSVAASCFFIFVLIRKHSGNVLLSFVAALMYLLGFGTVFYELAPLTDSFSILLFTVTLYFYLEKKWQALIFLVLCILQREYLLIVFTTLGLIDFIFFKKRYYFLIFCFSLLFFLCYLLLRQTIFYTPHLAYQASAGYFWSSLFSINFSLVSYFKQLAMTLNLLYIYFGILLYKKWLGLSTDRYGLVKVLLLFFQINFICHIAGHGNNCGRYFYLTAPYLIFLMVKEIKPVLSSLEIKETSE